MVASWYSWDHLWVQRLVGQRAGQRELLAGGLCNPPRPAPSSLDAIEGEHSPHVLGQGLGLWPLESINDWHDVLATVQSSHNLLEKEEGKRRTRGAPSRDLGARLSPRRDVGREVHIDFSLIPCGMINLHLPFVPGSRYRAPKALSHDLGGGAVPNSFRMGAGGQED